MSDFDLIIRSRDRDIGIVDGTFAALAKNLRVSGREEIDATNSLVLPGAIDAHVHFNEPGRTDWEGWETGSRAAAAGGTTTVFEMPLNAHPPTIDGASFDLKRAAAEKTSVIDFGLWGGLVPGNAGRLLELRDRGVVGLKAFMCNSGISDFPHVDTETLREGMRIAAELGLLVAVHAESEEITRKLTGGKLAVGLTSVRDYLETRPVEAELEAISQAIDLASETKCRLHIVHVSSGRGVALVAEACAGGVDVTCETCPHYLVLTDQDMERIGALAKCAPPLRDAATQTELWECLTEVSTIGSDHSPSPPEMKMGGDFFKIWGGISGCQHLLPLLIEETGENGRLSLPQIAALTSTNVAERFGIQGKGGFTIGHDADLAIFEPAEPAEITADSLLYRHRQSPYIGRRLRHRLSHTILRGQTVCRDGKVTAPPGGKLVRPVK